MKQPQKWNLLMVGLAAGVFGLNGCQDKNNNGMPDSAATTEQIENKVSEAGRTVEKGVATAVPAVEKAVEKGVDMASDAGVTGKVKAALMADPTIKAMNIDVTTKNKVVTLNGTVANNAQRALAVQIAKKAAGAGHPVKSALKVAGNRP